MKESLFSPRGEGFSMSIHKGETDYVNSSSNGHPVGR